VQKKFSWAFDLFSVESFSFYFRIALCDVYSTRFGGRALFLYEKGGFGTKMDIFYVRVVNKEKGNEWTR
jgi:hypothetical protein